MHEEIYCFTSVDGDRLLDEFVGIYYRIYYILYMTAVQTHGMKYGKTVAD